MNETININKPVLNWLRNELDNIYDNCDNFTILVEYCELYGFIAFQPMSDRWTIRTLIEECEKNECYINSVYFFDDWDNTIVEYNR